MSGRPVATLDFNEYTSPDEVHSACESLRGEGFNVFEANHTGMYVVEVTE